MAEERTAVSSDGLNERKIELPESFALIAQEHMPIDLAGTLQGILENDLDLSPPKLHVIGQQSSGKTQTLNYIIGGMDRMEEFIISQPFW